MLSNRDLLQQIERLLSDGDADASIRLQLAAHKDYFLNLLKFKAKNAEARQQVESRTVNTLSRGLLQLDADPDVRLALLLSDELSLDEVFCVELLLQAHQERGDLSAETAAGIYFEERRALLASLHRLLQFHALELDNTTDDMPVDESIYSGVRSLNLDLLAARDTSGKSTLLSRIVELIKDVSLEASATSSLRYVRDNTGDLALRTSLVQRERSQLCECLMYAVFIAKVNAGLSPADVAQLAELMHFLALKLANAQSVSPASGAQSQSEVFTMLQHTTAALAALLLGLSPSIVQLQDLQVDTERTAMASLVASADVKAALHLTESTGFHQLAAMAFGVLQQEHGSSTGRENVRKALEAGVLQFLATEILSSTPFQDDDPQPRELIARLSLSLLLRLIGTEEELVNVHFITGRMERVKKPNAEPLTTHTLGAVSTARLGDGMVSILHVLELCLQMRPEFALNADLRDEKLEAFLESVPFGGCMQSADVLTKYLGVLKSVASGADGARMVFHQLMHPHMPDQLSWGKLFTVMLQYCHWFQPLEGEADESGSLQAGGEAKFMSEKDMAGLVAYLELFSTILSEASPDEAATWVRQLEDKMSLRPLHEVLFQLMCHRVPHELKAALMNTINTFASSPDSAAELWERLKSTAIFEPSGTEGPIGFSVAPVALRYDLTYQLAEIEERAEVYPEVSAFVRLLNKLWEASKGSVVDFGKPYAHYTRFVREMLLGQLSGRVYKVKREKWELAEACFQHLRIVLSAAVASGDAAAVVAADAAGFRSPGAEVMLDILKEARSMRTVLAVAMTGTDQLVRERQGSEVGVALEGAVLAALQLIVCALEAEEMFLGPLMAAGTLDRDSGLVAVLKADARRIAVLTDYVRYPYSTQMQAESLRICKFLASCLPNMVDLLARGSSISSFQIAELQRARAVHVASALENSLFRIPDPADAEQGDTLAAIDPRASLVLELLLNSVDLPGPNMAQLLLGFPIDGDLTTGMMDPRISCLHYTCLTVVLKAAADLDLPHRRPRLFEQVVELIYLLASHPLTGPCLLPILRSPSCSILASQMDNVVCSPLPEITAARIPSLHARAWLLHLASLELHTVDTVIPAHADSARGLLGEFFDAGAANGAEGMAAGPHGGGAVSMEQRRARVLEILELMVYPLEEPQNVAQGEVRRLQEEMQLQELLFSNTPSAEGGVRGLSDRGFPVVDIPSFISRVMERYSRMAGSYSSTGGAVASNTVLRTACRDIVSLAHAWNEYQEESMAQISFLASWQELVEVAFSSQYVLLGSSARAAAPVVDDDEMGGGSMALVIHQPQPFLSAQAGASLDAGEVLYETMRAALVALERVLVTGMDRMAQPLCIVVRTLLARLQDEGSNGSAASSEQSGILPSSWLPSRCHEILLQILNLLERSRRNENVRVALYGALLAYLQICKGPRVREWPQAVLDAVLDQGKRTQSVATMDATQAELEQGNSLQLQSHAPRLIHLLSADALGGKETSRAMVFQLLASLVAADPVVANEVHRSDLPRHVLDGLAQSMASALVLPARQSQAACIIIEAQLGLLQGLCLAGPPHDRSASAQYVFSTGALRCLASCRALGTQVEELRGSSKASPLSLRARVGRIVRPTLRLLSCIMAALPASTNVTSEALEFVGSHNRLLGRLLSEVPQGGEAELEQGCLVAGILARLGSHLFRSQGAIRHHARLLDEKMWALCRLFLKHDEEEDVGEGSDINAIAAIANAKRQIINLLEQRDSLGLLQRQNNVRQVQRLRSHLEASEHRCRMIRCYLMRYIHKIVLHIASGGTWAFPGEDEDVSLTDADSNGFGTPGGFGFATPQQLQTPSVPGTARIGVVINCLSQAAVDLHELLGERLRLLEFLRVAQPGDDRIDDVLDEYGSRLDAREAAGLPEAKKLEEAKSTAAGVVASLESGIKQLLYLCELAVALILGESAKRILTVTDQDLQMVAHRVNYPFYKLGQIQPEHLPPSADPSHLTLLIRQSKKFLSQYN